MPKILLDTDTCIYIINNKPSYVREMFEKYNALDIAISSISLSELIFGIEKSKYKEQNKNALQVFLAPLDVLDFGYEQSIIYGKLRADLEKNQSLIGSMDMLIASHALSLGLILVTNNEKDFKKVPKLKVQNWIK
ncbi:MAG: VapC toxin family PIN domain ribonuclease [Proteobacteria bacterium]|nr:MAG: VapC toxin family PIN domain ribonuclease [Pseudomonadota bacterium]